jgi:hypothetical protein
MTHCPTCTCSSPKPEEHRFGPVTVREITTGNRRTWRASCNLCPRTAESEGFGYASHDLDKVRDKANLHAHIHAVHGRNL